MKKTIISITKEDDGHEVSVRGAQDEIMEAFEALVCSLEKDAHISKNILQIALNRGVNRAQGIENNSAEDIKKFVALKLMDELLK